MLNCTALNFIGCVCMWAASVFLLYTLGRLLGGVKYCYVMDLCCLCAVGKTTTTNKAGRRCD